jgi:hypothetical protein
VNVGCCLEHNEIEQYAKMSTTGWSYGVTELLLADGHIQGHNQVSMLELKEKYEENKKDIK